MTEYNPPDATGTPARKNSTFTNQITDFVFNIPGYTPIKQLSTDKDSRVFLAHLSSDRRIQVALKVELVKSDLPSSVAHEAEILRQLEHKNIIKIYPITTSELQMSEDSWSATVKEENREVCYISLKYMKGGSLLERLQHGKRISLLMRDKGHPLSPSQVISIFSQLADAVDYLHSQNVLHLDLKPSNILFSHTGNQVVISDFGVAKFKSSKHNSLEPIIGTPIYMSPEQKDGGNLDVYTDIYSLGITLAEVLLGYKLSIPDKSSDYNTYIRKEISRLPQSFQRVIIKATNLSPLLRYKSAKRLVNALRIAFHLENLRLGFSYVLKNLIYPVFLLAISTITVFLIILFITWLITNVRNSITIDFARPPVITTPIAATAPPVITPITENGTIREVTPVPNPATVSETTGGFGIFVSSWLRNRLGVDIQPATVWLLLIFPLALIALSLIYVGRRRRVQDTPDSFETPDFTEPPHYFNADDATAPARLPNFATVAPAYLVYQEGGDHLPKKLPIDAGREIRIGRKREYSDLVLDDIRVSRLHAVISEKADGFYIRDEGSAGGTLVNYRQLGINAAGWLLKHGDIINFNTVAYRFEMIDQYKNIPNQVTIDDATEDDVTEPFIDHTAHQHQNEIERDFTEPAYDYDTLKPVEALVVKSVQQFNDVSDAMHLHASKVALTTSIDSSGDAPLGIIELIQGKREDRKKYWLSYKLVSSIGRDNGSNIQLTDSTVSFRHATINYENEKFVIRDLGTKNGTFVNSKPITEHTLDDDDQIVVGGTRLQFRYTRVYGQLTRFAKSWDQYKQASYDDDPSSIVSASQHLCVFMANIMDTSSPQLIIDHKLYQIFLLDTVSLFSDITVIPRLWLVFAQRLGWQQENIDSLNEIVKQKGEELRLEENIHFILFLLPDQQITEEYISSIQINYLSSNHIVFLRYENLRTVLLAENPAGALKKYIIRNTLARSLSPYKDSGPIGQQMFFGRSRELREITEQLRSTSFAITGARRIGKTSLLYRLREDRILQKGFYTIFLDCGKFATTEEFLQEIVRLPISDYDQVTIKYLLENPPLDRFLVLLLDEVDKLIFIDSGNGWQLFNLLRSIVNTSNVRIILCGERTLNDALRDAKSPLFNLVNTLRLKRLDIQDVKQLVTRPMRNLEIKLFDEQTLVEDIDQFTSGHPNVIQYLCRLLIERIDRRSERVIAPGDIIEIVKDMQYQQYLLDTYWESATVLEKIISLLLVKYERTYGVQGIQRLIQEECQIEVSMREVEEALRALVDIRSILKWSNEGYVFDGEAFPKILRNTLAIEDMFEGFVEDYREERRSKINEL